MRSLAAVLAVLLLLGCQHTARSERSYDEIRSLVTGKTADQVLRLLGEPDTRQEIFDADERWIWWNFTTLEGSAYPPEVRGSIVHLEIIFDNPAQQNILRHPYSEWRIDDTFGVTFQMPSSDG